MNKATQTEMVLVTDAEREQAKIILTQHAGLNQALAVYQDTYGKALDALRSVVQQLRIAQLPPKEITLVLKTAGWTESRTSEVKAIVLSPDKVFDDYMSRITGFRLALKNARNALPAPAMEAAPDEIVDGFALVARGYKGKPLTRPCRFAIEANGLRYDVRVKRMKTKIVKAPRSKKKKENKK